MSKKTIYICDVCKKENIEKEATLIFLNRQNYVGTFPIIKTSLDLCMECVIKIGEALNENRPINN